MPHYAYSAIDENSTAVTGEIDAPARAEAIALLTDRDLFVTDIEVCRAPAATRAASVLLLFRRRRVRPQAKAAMLRQLATALQAGLPLLSALRVIQQQADSEGLRTLANELAEGVRSGESLSEAMAAHQREFSPLEASMVRVGETAGVLDEVMAHLAEFAERDVDVRRQIRSAATYPLFVLSLAAISVVVIVTVILPRVVQSVSEGVGDVALPAPTRILLAISGGLTSYWWLVLIILAAGIGGMRAWLARPGGRLAFDQFKLRIPVLNKAIRRIAVARFARTLATLSKAGIQILEALRVLRDTLGNEVLARKVDQAAAGITHGQSIAEPLRQTGEFPPLLIQVIAMGERTGRLDDLLLQTADTYEKETAAAIERVMTVLPAVMILILALVVVFILAAVLLPIVEMQTSVPGM